MFQSGDKEVTLKKCTFIQPFRKSLQRYIIHKACLWMLEKHDSLMITFIFLKLIYETNGQKIKTLWMSGAYCYFNQI